MHGADAPSGSGKVPSPQGLADQVDRILRSPGFSNSEVLQGLLTHLVRSQEDQPGRHVKEHEIATKVLGRGNDFDPRLDSTVRVHTGRLRTKLAEYYRGPGALDPITITIPKGAYHVDYQLRNGMPVPVPQPRNARRTRWWVIALCGWALAAAALSWGLWTRSARPPSPLPEAVRTFWMDLTKDGSIVVIFSNPQFLGSATRGMRYATPGAPASPGEVHDRYTGTGEAFALHELTRLFDQLGVAMHVKRSQLLTWDEARDKNLVFIGGPDTNHPQRELPRLQQFAFKTVEEEPKPAVGAVVNLQPQPGEERYYFCSGAPYTFDYAVIGLVPGLDGRHRALILAGTTTYGTQGAAEFLMADESVRTLLAKLATQRNRPLPYFEALLRIKVSGGVPVQPELVILRGRE
jgi:hypothetical protein